MGKLIVFEGNECSGKTTVIHLVKEKLLSAGYSVMATREPGGTKAGEDIRSIILDREYPQPINGRTEALLYPQVCQGAENLREDRKMSPSPTS